MDSKTHLLHYLALATILAVALFAFFSFQYRQVAQFVVIVCASLAYLAWGVIHHRLEDRVTVAVLLEYFLISGVVIAGAWLTLW